MNRRAARSPRLAASRGAAALITAFVTALLTPVIPAFVSMASLGGCAAQAPTIESDRAAIRELLARPLDLVDRYGARGERAGPRRTASTIAHLRLAELPVIDKPELVPPLEHGRKGDAGRIGAIATLVPGLLYGSRLRASNGAEWLVLVTPPVTRAVTVTPEGRTSLGEGKVGAPDGALGHVELALRRGGSAHALFVVTAASRAWFQAALVDPRAYVAREAAEDHPREFWVVTFDLTWPEDRAEPEATASARFVTLANAFEVENLFGG